MSTYCHAVDSLHYRLIYTYTFEQLYSVIEMVLYHSFHTTAITYISYALMYGTPSFMLCSLSHARISAFTLSCAL